MSDRKQDLLLLCFDKTKVVWKAVCWARNVAKKCRDFKNKLKSDLKTNLKPWWTTLIHLSTLKY